MKLNGDLVCVALRKVQSETGCSTRTIKKTYQKLEPFFDKKGRGFRHVDKVLRGVSGAASIRLDGCVGCQPCIRI